MDWIFSGCTYIQHINSGVMQSFTIHTLDDCIAEQPYVYSERKLLSVIVSAS